MRPVRAAAPSPVKRPGVFMDENLTPCKGKSFLNVFKAFALTGRFFVSVLKPRAMPWARSFCPFRAFC